ncbi:cysteine desulfurase/selenocysteine lyase [Maritalea mobilis]|uniref:Cysteine desulfurase n=1 Tax=Maritalea mobilis TaxID=483324 RepID=A0A4R6VUK9_9HYPH|nr:cysteine desulfurase [Maritalea mobilis]TDQ66416.1 cysteine desulfurase/selenocysteine lyase [Maritalea mobilis]
MLDLGKIREDFPILKEEVNGHRLVYLDSGASAQKPNQVLERIQHAYAHEYANVHRGLHTLSNRATEAFEDARAKVQKFFNAERVEEIVFTRSATEAINLVAQSFAGPKIGEGDEIIITKMEHHSNIVPWHFLRERQGAVIKWVDVAEDGSFDLDDFEAAISDRTKMVAITHMSNVMGTIVPIKKVTEIAHARNIPVMVDGSQGAVHLPVDVQDLDVDFYVATGHKLYGPTGIGVLYGKYDRLLDTRPFQGGGEMIADVFEDNVTYAEPPHRFEAGTPPIVQAIGLGAAIDYIESIGRDKIKAYEDEIGDYARQELLKINALRLIGDAPGKGAIFSFAIENVHAHDLSTILDRYGVAVRAGSHCAQPLLKRFGVTSTCRASFALYNGKDDVDALVAAIGKAQTFFG